MIFILNDVVSKLFKILIKWVEQVQLLKSYFLLNKIYTDLVIYVENNAKLEN